MTPIKHKMSSLRKQEPIVVLQQHVQTMDVAGSAPQHPLIQLRRTLATETCERDHLLDYTQVFPFQDSEPKRKRGAEKTAEEKEDDLDEAAIELYDKIMDEVTEANVNEVHLLKNSRGAIAGTPLILAVNRLDDEWVDILLGMNNIDVDKAVEQPGVFSGRPESMTALQRAIKHATREGDDMNPSEEDLDANYCRKDSIEIIKMLLNHGAKYTVYDVITSVQRETPQEVVRMLSEDVDGLPNTRWRLGLSGKYNALENAVRSRRLDLMEVLKLKINPNKPMTDSNVVAFEHQGEMVSENLMNAVWMLCAGFLHNQDFYYDVAQDNVGEYYGVTTGFATPHMIMKKTLDLATLQQFIRNMLSLPMFAQNAPSMKWCFRGKYKVVESALVETGAFVEDALYTDMNAAILLAKTNDELKEVLYKAWDSANAAMDEYHGE